MEDTMRARPLGVFQRASWLKPSDADLARVVFALGVLVLMTPLIVMPSIFYAWVVGKAVYARALILLMGGIWAVLAFRNPRYRLSSTPVLVAFGIYLTVALIATAFSVSPARSFWSVFERMLGVIDLLLGFLYVVCLVAVVRTGDQWRALLNWGIAAVFAVGLLALAQMAHLLDVEGRGFPVCRIGSTTGNPTYFGALLAVALPLSAALLADHAQRVHLPWLSRPWAAGRRVAWAYRGFLVASIALGIPMLFFTGSRGALVGALTGCIVILAAAAFSGGRPALRGLAFPVGSVMGLVIAGSLLSTVGVSFAPPGCAGALASERLAATTQSAAAVVGDLDEGDALGAIARASFGERAELWRLGIKASLERPVLGWGPENSGAAYERYMDKPYIARFGALHLSKPHNRVIEELNATGFVGLLAYLAVWVVLAVALLRRSAGKTTEDAEPGALPSPPLSSRSASMLASGVLGGLAGYFVADLFMFDTPATLWYWLLLVGFAAWYMTSSAPVEASDAPEQGAPNGEHKAWWQVAFIAGSAIVVAVGVFFVSVQPYIAAYEFQRFWDTSRDAQARLASAERSFGASQMPTSTLTRLVLRALRVSWPVLPQEIRAEGVRIAVAEVQKNAKAEPLETDPVLGLVHLMLAAARTPEELEQAAPLIRLLQDEVPNLPSTVWVNALYRIQRGEPDQAIAIIDGYVADAPALEGTFTTLREAAQVQAAAPSSMASTAAR